jgi:hypothetical protein
LQDPILNEKLDLSDWFSTFIKNEFEEFFYGYKSINMLATVRDKISNHKIYNFYLFILRCGWIIILVEEMLPKEPISYYCRWNCNGDNQSYLRKQTVHEPVVLLGLKELEFYVPYCTVTWCVIPGSFFPCIIACIYVLV